MVAGAGCRPTRAMTALACGPGTEAQVSALAEQGPDVLRPRRRRAVGRADVGGADLAAHPLADPDREPHGQAGAAELLQPGVHLHRVAPAGRGTPLKGTGHDQVVQAPRVEFRPVDTATATRG